MPNIYQDIKELVLANNYLEIQGVHREYIERFLNYHSSENAKALFDYIAQLQMKTELYSLLDDLTRYEIELHELLPSHRDHYVHSANVYLLGLALYNSIEILQRSTKIPRHAQDDINKQKTSFLFRWSLASVLHDVSYPLEMSIKLFNKYSSILLQENCGLLSIQPSLYSYFDRVPVLSHSEDVPDSLKRETSISLIANYLTDRAIVGDLGNHDYDEVKNFISEKIHADLKLGVLDHGVFSSLVTIKRIHKLNQRNQDWVRKNFYYDVIDSSTAIFLHNFYKYSGINRLFGCQKFSCFYPNSLGYLLCLCDTLCEWSRTNDQDHNQYHLEVRNNEIQLYVPSSKREDLLMDIQLLNEEISIVIRSS